MILEKTPASLRGALSRWLVEPRTGVFVGNVNARVREKLWQRVRSKLKNGGAVMVHSSASPQGYEIFLCGNTSRILADFEGLTLVRIPKAKKKT